MSNPTITFVSPRRFYDTATVAETHRRLLAEGHNISENALRGLVDSKKCCGVSSRSISVRNRTKSAVNAAAASRKPTKAHTGVYIITTEEHSAPTTPQLNRLDRFHQNLYHFNIH